MGVSPQNLDKNKTYINGNIQNRSIEQRYSGKSCFSGCLFLFWCLRIGIRKRPRSFRFGWHFVSCFFLFDELHFYCYLYSLTHQLFKFYNFLSNRTGEIKEKLHDIIKNLLYIITFSINFCWESQRSCYNTLIYVKLIYVFGSQEDSLKIVLTEDFNKANMMIFEWQGEFNNFFFFHIFTRILMLLFLVFVVPFSSCSGINENPKLLLLLTIGFFDNINMSSSGHFDMCQLDGKFRAQ